MKKYSSPPRGAGLGFGAVVAGLVSAGGLVVGAALVEATTLVVAGDVVGVEVVVLSAVGDVAIDELVSCAVVSARLS